MKKLKDESGQALVSAALCMTCLLGFVALATDVGVMLREKRLVQIAADSAAVSGAAELNYGDANVTPAAQAAATQNGFATGTTGTTVTVNGPLQGGPQFGPFAGNIKYVEVIVSQNQPTVFMGMFGRSAMAVTGRAVATLVPSQGCVYTVGTSGTGISMSNGAQLNAPGCGILDNSSSTVAASLVGGATITAGSVGVVGGVSASGGSITPAPVTGITSMSDPLASLQPPPFNLASCGSDPLTHFPNGGSSYSVGPGSPFSTTQNGNTVCYTSLALGSNGDIVTLNPGVYVITGAFTFASGTNLGGQGVTFYLTCNGPGNCGSVNISSAANFNFSAPTSGAAYNGILFFQDPSDTTPAVIAGSATSILNGILYFPDAAIPTPSLTIGNGATSTISASIVANSLSIAGGSILQENNYATVNPTTPLTAARLVE